ncbi:MAG: hypothetical protein M3Q77_00455 [Thermoproteota archaeon]|nr:hypothetical protein [Nitrosopumilus sp.]MDQ3083269.1 hypothetical protein [Thermoproteota archaeon]
MSTSIKDDYFDYGYPSVIPTPYYFFRSKLIKISINDWNTRSEGVDSSPHAVS